MPVNVHVEVWDPLMLVGAHDVVTPVGAETAERSMVPAKPPLAVRLTVDVADRPAENETLAGFAAIEKSGTGGPPALKNSSGEVALSSPCPRLPPPQTSSKSFASE